MSDLRRQAAVASRKFFNSDEGQEWFNHLLRGTPAITVGDKDEITFQAGIAEGWRRCLFKIEAITQLDPPKPEDLENH